jgi:ubiquinone/menaquinone biosynthesis C-methylase UbiE
MPLFALGTIDVTPGAAAALTAASIDSVTLLTRYQEGDWGETDERIQHENAVAVEQGYPIFSQYKLANDIELLVVTSADRSRTCMLLAREWDTREVSTQEGYDLWAASYDHEKNPLIAVEEPRVDALLNGLSMTTALDVGTGTGRYALKLARRGVSVTAIDQSGEMLAVARQAARTEGLTIAFQQVALERELPFDAGLFDFLSCALMLCHVPTLIQAVQEFGRVLRPDGHLLITDFHPEVVAAGWRTIYVQPGVTYLLPNIAHTRADYLEAVTRAGLTILDAIDVPVREVPDGYLPETVIRAHGDRLFCLIVLARK